MMNKCSKYWITGITAAAILTASSIIFAQSSDSLKTQATDSLNLQSIVQKQIEEAKMKNSVPVILKNTEANLESIGNSKILKPELKQSSSSGWIYKSIIMLVGIIAVSGWLVYRRINRKKVMKVNDFKKNIKLMREEKFIKEIDPRLKDIRTKLILISVILNEDKIINANRERRDCSCLQN